MSKSTKRSEALTTDIITNKMAATMTTYSIFLTTISMSLLLIVNSCAIHSAYKRHGAQVGEIVPCSARVAKKISESIKRDPNPKKIIEVGAGAGALSHKILDVKNRDDLLDLIEIDKVLCEELEKEGFGRVKNVFIRCMDFLAWQPQYHYDHIVSTLPLNSMSPELALKLVNHLIAVAKDGAYLNFVEFKWLPTLRLLFMDKSKKDTYLKTRKIIEDFYAKYGLYHTNVYLNFPPLIIYHLKIDKSKGDKLY